MDKAIQTLLAKEAIKKVRPAKNQFVSSIFVVEMDRAIEEYRLHLCTTRRISLAPLHTKEYRLAPLHYRALQRVHSPGILRFRCKQLNQILELSQEAMRDLDVPGTQEDQFLTSQIPTIQLGEFISQDGEHQQTTHLLGGTGAQNNRGSTSISWSLRQHTWQSWRSQGTDHQCQCTFTYPSTIPLIYQQERGNTPHLYQHIFSSIQPQVGVDIGPQCGSVCVQAISLVQEICLQIAGWARAIPVDAFPQDWSSGSNLIHPVENLLLRVVKKIREDRASAQLIAHHWPNQP